MGKENIHVCEGSLEWGKKMFSRGHGSSSSVHCAMSKPKQGEEGVHITAGILAQVVRA